MNAINGERYSDRSSIELPLMSGKRNPYWDVVKGVLIFLVVYGHIMQLIMAKESGISFWDSVAFKCIYLFHMPLFMLISGYFASHSIICRGFSSLGRYSKRLLIPIFSYSVWVIFSHLFSTSVSIKQIPLSFFLTATSFLWFLSAVFLCSCFLWAYTCAKTIIGKIFFGFLPILLFLYLQTHPHTCKYFGIGIQITYLWPFFLLGHWLRQHHFDSENIPKWWLVFVPVTIGIAFLCNESLFVYNTPLRLTWYSFEINLLRTVAAIIGSMALCASVRYSLKLLNSAFIHKIGQASLAIYLLHFTSIPCIYWPIQKWHIISNEVSAFVFTGIVTVVTFGFYLLSRKIKWVRFLLYGENFH